MTKPLFKNFHKPSKIIRYKSLDKLMSQFFDCKVSKLSECDLGCSDINTDKSEKLLYSEFKECVEEQQIWGFADISNNVVKVWYGITYL